MVSRTKQQVIVFNIPVLLKYTDVALDAPACGKILARTGLKGYNQSLYFLSDAQNHDRSPIWKRFV
jgi:hypothetical protein